MSTVNLFHVTFPKSRLCIAKPATQAKGLLVFQHTAPFLPTFLLSCLLNSRSAPTSRYRSWFTSWVTGYEVSVPVVQCLSCCWNMMCFSGWEVAVLLFHLSEVYGRTQSNKEECWWVNNESLRQSKVLSKEKDQQFQISSRSISEDFRLCWNFCLQLLLCYVVCVGSILSCDSVRHTYVCMLMQFFQEMWSLKSCSYVLLFPPLLLFCRVARGHNLLL